MLANGITLKYKKKTGTPNTFTLLEGLKEVPELGVDPEKVENTTLADKVKQYEFGIGDAGELEYKFKYDNSKATSAYRILRNLMDDKETVTFEQKYPDTTTVEFDGQVSVKLGGGGVNGAIEFILKIGLQSDFKFTDPA